MYQSLVILVLMVVALLALGFSTVTYALREFSRARLEDWLHRHKMDHWYTHTVDSADELSFIAAVMRLVCNAAILICLLALFHDTQINRWVQYLYGFFGTCVIALFISVAIPLAIARHFGEAVIGMCAPALHIMHHSLRLMVLIMHGIDHLIGRASGEVTQAQEQQQIEEQILTAVEEGQKEGIVDDQERKMIESVIEFRNATVGEVMTARPDMVAVDAGTSLLEARELCEKSGLSRLPVYEHTLDHVIGVLNVRDLVKYIGRSDVAFDIREAVRPAFFVPETKPLGDLLRDFRLQKVHLAIVLDEYGGTAGLVTIEDVLEQLVGEISDEHEAQEPAMLKKIDEQTWEADARVNIADLNRTLPLGLPEEADYHTLGGYVSNMLGHIPAKGAVLNLPAAKLVVTEAKPQRIDRLRIELPTPQSS